MSHGKEFGFYAEDTGEPKKALEELRKLCKVRRASKQEEDAGEGEGTEVRSQD